MCTVTGSTVIDFTGRIHSVPDRCGYTLMKSSSVPGFQVLGVFQERRRRDTSFLDRVILKLDEARVQISLEQGSRLYVSCQNSPTNVMLCTLRVVLPQVRDNQASHQSSSGRISSLVVTHSWFYIRSKRWVWKCYKETQYLRKPAWKHVL